MKETVFGRAKKAWNIFRNKDPSPVVDNRGGYYSGSSSKRPDQQSSSYGSRKRILSSRYCRIAADVSSLTFKHVKVDNNGKYKESIDSELNDRLNYEANIDQAARPFIQDIVYSLCEDGHIAVVPTELEDEPQDDSQGGLEIYNMRIGRITEWMPKHVRVHLYDEERGMFDEVVVSKRNTGILTNPFFEIMNEANSTLSRLLDKMQLLDTADHQSLSGKLDVIIQLPYTIRSEKKREQAEQRRKDIEEQMSGSKYGIAYIDAAEKITQLNRAAENQLLPQIHDLTTRMDNELGLTKGVFDGSAKEEEILNYYNRTIEVFANTIVDEFKRKFLTRTAKKQGHSIMFFRDMFKLTPISEIAELADKLGRNEILSPNEIRGIIGFEPHPDPKSDELRNRNLNVKDQIVDGSENQNGSKKDKLKDEGKEKE